LRGTLPILVAAVLDLSDTPSAGALHLRDESGKVILVRGTGSEPIATFLKDA
jgi:hypothetical protein